MDAPGLAESLARRDPPVLPEGRPGQVWSALLHALAAGTAGAVADVTGLLGPKPRLVVYGGGASSRPRHWSNQTIEVALRAGLLRAVDEAGRRGDLPGFAIPFVRRLVETASLGRLVAGGVQLSDLFR